jgi:hypothetical protein
MAIGPGRLSGASFEDARRHSLECAAWTGVVDAKFVPYPLYDGIGYQCPTCPDTYIALQNGEPYCIVFPHNLGEYGGYVKAWLNEFKIRMVDKNGLGNSTRLEFKYSIPWDITEERLQTILMFS